MNRRILRLTGWVPGLALCLLPTVGMAVPKSASKPVSLPAPNMTLAFEVITTLESFGTSDLGFRSAGSAASLEAASYVATTMTHLGLTDVTLEPVAVDAWEFHDAWLQVPGYGTITAASFGGSPGTNRPVTAELVYVGNGYRSDYEERDVTGKIVLANWQGNAYWIDAVAMEAGLHGAAALVVAPLESNFGQADGALQCHDGQYRPSWIPVLSIPATDAVQLIALLSTGPQRVTAYSDIEVTPASSGGTGNNVVGYLPGIFYGEAGDELVILGAHHDAWFRGASDDGSGVASVLVLADMFQRYYAAKGTRPARTLVFTTHEAEEYGIRNAYYDWLYGAYEQITRAHADWVGKAAVYLCFEMMGAPDTPLIVNLPVELSKYIEDALTPARRTLPYQAVVAPALSTWAEHFTFTAAGVPSIFFGSVSPEWFTHTYHSQYDTSETLDFSYLERLYTLYGAITLDLATRSLLPYNLAAEAQSLSDRLNHENPSGVAALIPIYEAFGVDPSVNLERTVNAAQGLLSRTQALSSFLRNVPTGSAPSVNPALMEIEAVLRQSLLSIGGFPYEAPASDIKHLYAALEQLATPGLTTKGLEAALDELRQVGLLEFYDWVSKETYLDVYSRQFGPEVTSWGLQSHQYPPPEVWDVFEALERLWQMQQPNDPSMPDLQRALWHKGLEEGMPALETGFAEMWQGLEQANATLDRLMQAKQSGRG